jgi:hypothetical protein
VTLAASIPRFRARSDDAVARNLHHDQRRSYLLELFRDGFGIQADKVVLEHNVRLDAVRGRIDVLFRQVVFEVKRDVVKEHEDAVRELAVYLESLSTGTRRQRRTQVGWLWR